MHVRRALLLFATVLALAALVASISAPERDENSSNTPGPGSSTPTAQPGPGGDAEPRTLRFGGDRRPLARKLAAGRPGVIQVSVRSPGLVTIPSLGLSEDAAPATPATLDVLRADPGEHEIQVTPAGSEEARRVGVLVIER